MSYLSRESSPISQDQWEQIDLAVTQTAKNILTGRRFLHLFGPLGIGVDSINIDDADTVEEISQDGLITTAGRRYVQIPTLYKDFTLFARDIESSIKAGYQPDLMKVVAAAESCAMNEDKLIYFGNKEKGYEGLLTADGVNKLNKSDWGTGENAFTDIASGIRLLVDKGFYGTYSLVVSPDLYMQMQRLQIGTGLLEIERVSKLVDGNLFRSPVLGDGKAALICSEPKNVDLVVGQDIATAYLEQKDLNHSFRVLETVLLRIKRKGSIVVFE